MNTKTKPARAANHTRKTAAKTKKSDGSLRALLLGIAERGKLIPPEEQAKIPVDGAKNLDHYLYGAHKEEH